MLEWVGGLSLLSIAGLAYKLWQYRAAIIQLQADMTLVLNELTAPHPMKEKKVSPDVSSSPRPVSLFEVSP